MALTGLQIFKLMPKTNCKECGFPTCLAFSMALAATKTTLDTCPYVSDEAKDALGAASAPPVAKIVIGAGDKARETGDETVLFRHDKRFNHPACIAITINAGEADFDAKLAKINDLVMERVGETVSVDAIALVDDGVSADDYAAKAKIVAEKGKFVPLLMSGSVDALTKAVAASAAEKPIICAATADNWEALANLAKDNDCALVVKGTTLDDTAELVEKVAAVTKKLIVAAPAAASGQNLADLTQVRRQAIRKKFRPFGYPSIVCVTAKTPVAQVAEAVGYICKFGSIVVMDACEKSQILPLCALRQNIFSDPQVPAQVEPGMYAIGDANENSPVYCTTNFSLTYYTVEGEVSGSRIPSWIISCPTDGTSVLTAWAAGKFTPDKIAEYIAENKFFDKVNHKNIVIPGYVAALKAPLAEKTGLNVIVGPAEASGLPAFAKANFANA